MQLDTSSTLEIGLLAAILLGALLAFASQRFRVEFVAMGVLVCLFLTRILSAPEALAGFSNPAVITVGAILVMSRALVRTGVAAVIGRRLLLLSGRDTSLALIPIMIVVALLSAFINDVAATAVMLPAVLEVARRNQTPPSKLLIPLAFASLLGGSTTLIGTPPNILISEYAVSMGLAPFHFFEFTPVGLAVATAGILFTVFVGKRLLPAHQIATESSEFAEHDMAHPELYHLEERLLRLLVPPDSSLVGQSIGQTHFRQAYHWSILAIRHGAERTFAPQKSYVIRAGDELLLKGRSDAVASLESELHTAVEDAGDVELQDLQSKDVGLVEAMLAPHSRLVGKTMRHMSFRERYAVNGLAIWRGGRATRVGVADTPLQSGDAILMYGPRSALDSIQSHGDLVILGSGSLTLHRSDKAPAAVGALVLTVLLAATGAVPMSIAALIGAGLVVFAGCLDLDEAYRSIHWPLILVVAAMLPAALAVEKTGAAQLLAQQVVETTQGSATVALFAILGVTLLASQFLPNAATAALMAPIAMHIALDCGAEPRAFLLGVAVTSSMAFMTPFSHPSCMLVMAPGGYRFSDFIKVGLPVSLLLLVTLGAVLALGYL